MKRGHGRGKARRQGDLSPKAMDRGTCCDCGKVNHVSRKAARQTIRVLPANTGMREYRCPCDPTLWHIGHMPVNVLRGRLSAGAAYAERTVQLDDTP